MDIRDVPEFDVVFTDIERGMGVKHKNETDIGLLLHRISDVDIQDIPKRSWLLQLFYEDPPECEICGRPIEGTAVRFNGPFFECPDKKMAACFDRKTCNAAAHQNELEEEERVRETMEKALRKARQEKVNSLQMWGS